MGVKCAVESCDHVYEHSNCSFAGKNDVSLNDTSMSDINEVFANSVLENQSSVAKVTDDKEYIANTSDVHHVSMENDCTENHSEDDASIYRRMVTMLNIDNDLQRKQIDVLTKKIMKMNLCFEFSLIENSDQKVRMHTGIPSKNVFNILFKLLSNISTEYNLKWNVLKVPRKEQLLMTLMKLKMDLKYYDLAQRFGCSESTVCNIVRTWVLVLHEVLFLQLMQKIPSRKANKKCLPKASLNFSQCRITLDCTEVFCDRPRNIRNQKSTFSAYKHHNTCKDLLGVAPNSFITFVSDLYPGSLSDKKIVQHSGICGDMVLVDKAFLIQDIVPYGVSVNMPPFLTTEQFTKSDITRTLMIARARVHVERAIRQVKSFITYIPNELHSIATEVFQKLTAKDYRTLLKIVCRKECNSIKIQLLLN